MSSSQLGPKSGKGSSQGKCRLASHGGWGSGLEALSCMHTLATRSAPASAQDSVTLSAAVPHLEVSVCILHIFTRLRRLLSPSCKPEGRFRQHRWLTLWSRTFRAPELRCNSLMLTGCKFVWLLLHYVEN